MPVIVECFKHVEEQHVIIVTIRIENDGLLRKTLSNTDDIMHFIHCLELLMYRSGPTISVSISSDLTGTQCCNQRNSMHLIGYLVVKLCELESRSISRQEFVDGTPDNNHVRLTRLERYITAPIRDRTVFCLDQVLARDLTLIDGSLPQVVAFRFPLQSDRDEAVLGIYPREVIPAVDVKDEGSCSGIVWVLSKFKDHEGYSRWHQGSGAIIDDIHVLTVGHNVCHREYGLAVSITICRDVRAGPDDRHVSAGAVHFHWAKTHSDKNDFAILRVSEQFSDKIRPMKHVQTPTSGGSIKVKIYGFPGDMPKDENGRWLAHLCWSQSDVQYTNGGCLLCHYGDTEGGSSGGPIVDSSGAVIAVHKAGGHDTNKAVVLNHHGNDVDKFIKIVTAMAGGSPVDHPIKKGAEFMFQGWVAACFG